jgi:hypothetical protein
MESGTDYNTDVAATNRPQGTSVQNQQLSLTELFVIVFIILSFDMHLLRHTPHSVCKGFIGLDIRRGFIKTENDPRQICHRARIAVLCFII